jgi:hypothetical protein
VKLLAMDDGDQTALKKFLHAVIDEELERGKISPEAPLIRGMITSAASPSLPAACSALSVPTNT